MNKHSRNFVAAFMGTALEFYDFALFGLLAPLFSKEFFPKDDPTVALISTYLIFAAGFLIRPLGGLVFGYIGDTLGRRKALLVSILMMLLPTFFIGMLPTYEQVGILAPVVLAMCRLLQGLCAGGEFSNAAIFVIEHSHEKHKYLSGSLVTASSVIGMLLASSMASICALEGMPTWGWRVPFFLSIPVGLIGFYIRRNTEETTDFKNILNNEVNNSNNYFSFFKFDKRPLLTTFGIGCFIGILYYVPFVFMNHYISLVASYSSVTSLILISGGLFIYMICICIAGFLADKIGPHKLMIAAISLVITLAIPVFMLITTGEFIAILFCQFFLSALAGFFVGPANGLTASLFETKNRCKGVSFSLSLGISIFGGFTPVLLTYLIHQTQNLKMPAYWMMLGAAIAYISIRSSLQKRSASYMNLSEI
jgi:MHS family proline/betaine transporter-like MFS transporter